MRIGIIGAGNIGGTMTAASHSWATNFSIANSRGPDALAVLAKETGARPVTVEQAARAGDVVIVTIPEKSVRDLRKGLFNGVSRDVVVVDTRNYYPTRRDGLIQEIENGKTESRWVSDRLGRSVVKAFNEGIFRLGVWERGASRKGRGAGSRFRSRGTILAPRLW